MKSLWSSRPLVWLAVFVCVCAWLLLAPAAMAAPEGPPAIQFADDAAIHINWPEGKIAFAVQNNTTTELALAVHVEAFTANGERIEAAELVQSAALTLTLPAAGSVWVSIPLVVKPAQVPVPGSYASMVAVAEQTQDIVIRKPITLKVIDPAAVVAAAPLAPGVAAYTVRAYRLCPFAPPWCAAACALPVKGAPAEASLPQGTLGYLLGGEGGALLVSLDSYTPTLGAKLAYDFSSGWGLAGSYSGKVDLAPADDAEGEVDLTVNVTDAIWYPILLLITGVFITAWTQNWLGVRRPLWQLVGREAAARIEVDELKPVSGYAIHNDAVKLLDEVKAEAVQLDSVWLNLLFAPGEVDAAKERHAQLERKLAGVEQQIEVWQGWEAKLQVLKTVLENETQPAIAAAAPPPALPGNLAEPRFYASAAALGAGEVMTVANFSKKVSQVDKAIALAKKWGPWEQALAWTREQLDKLQDLKPGEQRLAEATRLQANSAWVDLWTAADLDDLAARQTEAEISAAVDGVSRLLHRLPRIAAAAPPDDERGRKGGVAGFALPLLPVADLPAQPAARVQRAQNALRLGDRAFLGIAVVVALVTGLSELYFGKNFGSLEDWLKALTWGAGAKLGVDLVKTAMDRFFVRS